MISLVFDDGYTIIHQEILPLLNHLRLPAVFAVPLDHRAVAESERVPTTPWQQWLPLSEVGHEIAAHTVSHRDLTTLSDQQLENELRLPREQLGATTLIYPGGAHDERVVLAARRHYGAARTVRHGFETVPPRDPMRLKTFNFTRKNFSVTKANALALAAWLSGRWLIETYHLIGDSDDHELLHSVPAAGLKKHLRFIARLPVTVATIQQVTRRI
jgi:peptidoglycan/xylan/chitin deacetylase (PgdA/CDA1 family)